MIGDIIKLLRTNKGMTRKQLADALEVSNSTVSMYERNQRKPPISMIPTLSAIFEVPITTFFLSDPTTTTHTNYTKYITLLTNYQLLDTELQDIVDEIIQKFITPSTNNGSA